MKNEVLERIKSKTPKFWKRVRAVSLTLTAIGTTLMLLKQQYDMTWLSEEICEKLIVAGAIGATLAQMTVEDKKENEVI